ncbi:Macrophage colony-stimulating factor 1 receptor [Emydomyces testavorans]|uniref:Macrophage colony-stimulating factor 1 receptor n=1 Tax=Emydomyces testavorans TaxID=2070801 RepID=A0AAF0DEX2_9EURO|nr:Macrophage colony-stimulating factor 1 receptor [Emydomyces testavorans]
MSSPARLLNIAEGKLTAQPLEAVPQLFATLLSYGIRAYTWHYYRIYIDIHALQISLLAGRIFFKGIRYHGENETILVQTGYITWRYWLRSAQDIDLVHERTRLSNNDYSPKPEAKQEEPESIGECRRSKNGSSKKETQFPCRIEVSLRGVEWFVYNRSAAYDTILSGFRNSAQTGVRDAEIGSEGDTRASVVINEVKEASAGVSRETHAEPHSTNQQEPLSQQERLSGESESGSGSKAEVELPRFLSLLPIWIRCHKGALVVGNEHTKSILTTTFEKGSGKIDAGSSGPLDIYKQIFDFELLHPVMQLKPNPDFKQSQLTATKSFGSLDVDPIDQSQAHRFHRAFRRRRQKLWHSLRDLVPYFQQSVESFQVHHKGSNQPGSARQMLHVLPGEPRWLGLTRYLDEESRNEHEGWNAIEYGRFSTLLDCPSIKLRYHWDIPGKVTAKRVDPASSVRKMSNDINGAEPPEWGMHLTVKGGTINYGPWTDRERVGLQAMLFPNSYHDSQAAEPVGLGQLRQSTKFIFTIDFEDETNLRIPTREPSRDCVWKGRAEATKGASKVRNRKEKKHPRSKEADRGSHGTDIRPFGWLALRIDGGSRLDYQMDMFATTKGYCNRLVLELQGTKMTSSVNHGVLWNSGPQRISCDLSNPLEWNSLHTWSFTIDSDNLELFVLRDHIFLFTDLVNDWTSGPHPEFFTFVPFQYDIRLSFTHVQLFLNVNDSNIINNPTDTDDNSFLTIKSESLISDIRIPIVNYIPKRNTVPFNLRLANATMDLSAPLWNTHRSFIENPSMAALDSLMMSGSYAFNTLTSSTLTDVLTLDLSGNSPKLYLYGFVVNAFLKIKENYFGENMHFKTLEEYQEMANSDNPSLPNMSLNKSNDLDVILCIHAEDCKVLLPSNIYDRLNCVAIEAASLETDLRFTNYYMDLQTSFSPLVASLQSLQSDNVTSGAELFIDGLSIYGHRLFGLPPTEPTYVCNWDFNVGRVVGECSVNFLKHVKSALRSFAYSIDDEENSLPPLHPVVLHDVVFLRAKVDTIRIWVLLDATAVLLSSGPLDLDLNDWAGTKFSEHLNLSLPDISFAIVDRKSAMRLESGFHHPVQTYAYFHTSVNLAMVERKANLSAKRALQQRHVRVHDQRTQRTPWLLWDDLDEGARESKDGEKPNTPAMPVPFMPPPIRETSVLSPNTMPLRSSNFSGQHPSSIEKRNLPSFRYEKVGESEPDVPQQADSHFSTPISHNTNLPPGIPLITSRPKRPTSQFSLESEARSVLTKDHIHKMSTSKKVLSSAWTMPNFRFHRIVLDRSDLPPLKSFSSHRGSGTDGKHETEFIAAGQDSEATETYLLLDLISGLTGVCRPEALYAVTTLLEDLQPVHPIEVIDNLQSTVVSNILNHAKRLPSPKRVMTLSLQLPTCRLRFINAVTNVSGGSGAAFKDQFDLEALNVRALISKKTELEKETVKPKQTGLTAHLTAKSLSLSVLKEGLEDLGEHGIFHFRAESLMFWSVAGKETRSRVQVQDIGIILPNESIQCLASFVRRTNKLVNSVILSIKRSSTRETERLQSLVYQLTKIGSQTPDPQFLTRPSYVLRAAEEHLRVNDSWKVLSRLRNIYKSLPEKQAQQLTSNCIDNTIPYSSDSEAVVLSNFDKWLAWDLPHVKNSYVMKMIWGSTEADSSVSSNITSRDISVFIRSLRVSLNNEDLVLLVDLSTLFRAGSSDQGGNIPPKAFLAIQNYCSDLAVKLRWELIELIEENLDVISNFLPQPSGDILDPNVSSDKEEVPILHIVTVAENASAILDGINLRIALLGNTVESSIIHRSRSGSLPEKLSVLLTSETASAEFISMAKRLMLWKLFDPNIFLSHTSTMQGSDIHHDWKCNAGCQRLRYDMVEEPLGLIQVADRFVEDEVKHLLHIATAFSSHVVPKAKPSRLDIHRCHITTFLDDYQLRLMLLPSITYMISGDVIRLSLAPAAASRLEIDFDIKSNTHILQSNNQGKERVISSLTIPSINGRVVKSSLKDRIALDVCSTMELIKLDADSVRNILAAINGPEISHLISDLQHDARILEKNIGQVVSHRSSPSPEQSNSKKLDPVFYKLRLTLAGINIHSSAPSLRSENSFTDMNLGFGVLQINLENIPSPDRSFEPPQLDVSLSQVIFDLGRRERDQLQSFGNLNLCAQLSGTSRKNDMGESVRYYHLSSRCLQVELSAEMASMMVDIAAYLQERFKTLEMSQEIKHLRKLRRIRSRGKEPVAKTPAISVGDSSARGGLFDAIYSVDVSNIQLSWLASTFAEPPRGKEANDLVFSIDRIELATGRQSAARLRIEAMQLQMVPFLNDKQKRSQNSALLPEAVFDVAYFSLGNSRRLAFQAAGKALDIRMTSDFILPACVIQRSLASASESFRKANSRWRMAAPSEQKKKPIGANINQLTSLLIDADFAGAVVSLQGKNTQQDDTCPAAPGNNPGSSGAKYSQYFPQDTASIATLRAPGVAIKVQFEDTGGKDPTLNAEIKIAASTNVLHPTVVPLITEITSSVKEVVGDSGQGVSEIVNAQVTEKGSHAKSIGANDPTTILGRCILNMGLRICKQEFTLSCQPIARVAATARFEDSYITVNTVQSTEQRRFFAVLIAFNKLKTSIKHVYSSESTANFDIESIVVSMMNSKHVSSSSGISAILKISPTRLQINAKQVQDFLLFHEIWMPPDSPSKPQKVKPSSPEGQAYIVQQYQQMASAEAFPWNSTIAIEQLDVQLDLGQTLGKSKFTIKNLWLSSKKNSDWEQNLCVSFETVSIQSVGRLSGFVELSYFKIRTSIEWVDGQDSTYHTPLIQAAIGFSRLQSKISFEYQPFLVTDVVSFDFLMYNVRDTRETHSDRLVGILEGGKFQVFCTTLTASQGLALFQTLQRLVQDKQAAYEASLKEIEMFLRRRSTVVLPTTDQQEEPATKSDSSEIKMPISLQTHVVVNLQEIKIGAFPSTFQDNQIFKLEALDAETQFSVAIEAGKIHSGLSLTLGQLRVALSSVNRPNEAILEELSVSEIVKRAAGSRGGTILKVPRLVATMETWQAPTSNHIDYIFKSVFEGKVDVGWNYSRIAFIRGMWDTHSRALANRLGKPLPQAAVQITGGPKGEDGEYSGQEKITAVVNVPVSRYSYTALETPVIETPQLRDMGEATPPLEWIGLHRDKLPNITHQIIIVTLMEVAKDVEDAYSKILGS